jgi:ABC-type multidrug transport system permease subunit
MTSILSDIYSVFWLDLRNLRHRWHSLIATSFVLPFLYLFAFGFGLGNKVEFDGLNYLSFVIPGIIALTSFSTSFMGASQKLQVDRFFYKSFDELLMSPIPLHSIVIGKALIGVLRGLFGSLAILFVGFVMSPSLMITPVFLVVLFVSCFVSALFGVFVAFLMNSHGAMTTFNTVVILPMTFLCGTFLSLDSLPPIARDILSIIPLTHSTRCLRAAALGQPFPYGSFLALLGLGLVFIVGSIITLKKRSV